MLAGSNSSRSIQAFVGKSTKALEFGSRLYAYPASSWFLTLSVASSDSPGAIKCCFLFKKSSVIFSCMFFRLDSLRFRFISIALGISWAIGRLPDASKMGKANASDLPLDVPVVRHRCCFFPKTSAVFEAGDPHILTSFSILTNALEQ